MQDRPYFTFVPAGPRTTTALHRIVIVGGGAGGLELAVRLGEKLKHERKAEIVLVDPLLTHVWKPLLHEVAAGTLITADAGLDFLQQAKRHHFRFHLGAMASLDRKRKEIGLSPLHDELGNEIAPRRSLWYDTLVIAVGSRDNDFGIPGVKEHCVPLNGPDDAQHFHRRLLALFARTEMLNRGPVRVVIVGGGATGVELAAELLDSTRIIASYGAHLQQYPSAIRICLVDSAARLLSALPEHLGQQSARDLAERGVEIRLQQKVIGIDQRRVILSDGQKQHMVASDITVWAAGIRCPDMLAGIDGLESNRLNQLVVTPSLQTTRDSNIFALGDCASYTPVTGQPPVPPKAQAAHQEARFLARTLIMRLEKQALPSFTFHDRGSLVSLGEHEAVGNIPGWLGGRTWFMEGLLARFSYWLLYRRHLAILLGFNRAFLAQLGSWFSGRSQPRVKLH